MQLCSNRPEGFGPHSNLSSPFPTACFVDIILIPLPVWLALLFLPILFAIGIHHTRQNYNPSTAHLRSRTHKSCLYTTISALYYILILCNVLMQTLEIVRLELLHFGIGLLPFAYVGLLMGAGFHWTRGVRGRVRGWQGLNGLVWFGGVVVCVVKTVALVKEGINGRKGSKYPVSDQVIDVAVMAGVYAVIGVLELLFGAWRAGRRDTSGESVGSRSPDRSTMQEEHRWGMK